MNHRTMLKVREVKHPISEEIIGLRIVAAIENEAGLFMGNPVPSFRKPFFITEGSDCPEITPVDVKRVMDACRWAGYKSFVPVGETMCAIDLSVL